MHTLAAVADLGGQRRVEKVLAIFQIVFINRGVKLADLLLAQALQQLDGGGSDLDTDAFERAIELGELLKQLGAVWLRLGEDAFGGVQPVDIARQLGAAVPLQMRLQAGFEPGLLLLYRHLRHLHH